MVSSVYSTRLASDKLYLVQCPEHMLLSLLGYDLLSDLILTTFSKVKP